MILFWAFIVAVAIQCCYLCYPFMRILWLKGGTGIAVQQRQFVSIIVCARNEAANLQQNLPLILQQRYSNDTGIAQYEVIVVNDESHDNTAIVLAAMQQQYSHLKVVSSGIESARVLKGKKHALSVGVANAAGAWLLLTDADCRPAGAQWLELMVAPLAAGKEIVAGYGGYDARPGLLNAFIRWETLHTFMQYSSYALAGMPYMAVGRNMACTKTALLEAQQLPMWNLLPSGDDDMLVRIVATPTNMAVVSDKRTFTYSESKESWAAWAGQKQRHLSTGKYYKRPVKMLLGAYAVSHALVWLLCVVIVSMQHPLWMIAAALMAIRCAGYWLLWTYTAQRLQEKKLFYFFPLFDLGWMLYNFAFFPYITWKNKNHWT